MSSIKHKFRTLLWRAGYDLSRFTPTSHPIARRIEILQTLNIDTVLDIGANAGQFALQLRNDLGYTKNIISFEPISSAFQLLNAKTKVDPYWEAYNIAIGDVEKISEINIAGNSDSSSLLDMLPTHLKSAPESKYIGKESVKIKKLDSIFNDLCKPTSKIYMKIDTQGFEYRVLKGADNSLKHIDTVQMEMSLVPLYDGETLFNDMYMFMSGRGYSLISIEPIFSDPKSGQIMQVDGIFHRF